MLCDLQAILREDREKFVPQAEETRKDKIPNGISQAQKEVEMKETVQVGQEEKLDTFESGTLNLKPSVLMSSSNLGVGTEGRSKAGTCPRKP